MQWLVNISDEMNQETERLGSAEFSGGRLTLLQDNDATFDGVNNVVRPLNESFFFREQIGSERQIDEVPP